MDTLSIIKEKARQKRRRVVLPEGTEPRVIMAAKKIVSDRLAGVTLLGDPAEITRLAGEHGLDLSTVEVINPTESPDFEGYAADFMKLREKKGITEDEARATVARPLYFGAMLVRHDRVDASVAGSVNTTGDVLRAGIQVIGLKEGINTVSSFFMMMVPEYGGEQNRVFFYADGAVVPNPTAEQLVSITVSTAESMRNLLGREPKIAMLSFSTKGSAQHDDVTKVVTAFEMLKKEHPELKVDGELQVDAAIVPEIAAKKSPGSPVGGEADILIFPDLDAGNIAYKLTQRLAKATATGPIIQGLAKPANDLSRGCSAEDIVDVTAIAVLMKG
ncbi:MAG: phosphate acetyltransferase [Candidatus Zixiibacteriota bacterium]|nr:MAG: phosphate acetyltransferase [candidate division Zixibacteria bacterium]